MTKINEKDKLKAGFQVSDRVEILSVRLIESRCKQTPKATSNEEKKYDIRSKSRFEINEDKSLLIVFVLFEFDAFEKATPDDPIISIKAEFVLFYKISSSEDLTDEGFTQFAEMNGTFNAWPYWREFVQNTIARMELPNLTLPVFRAVPSLPKSETKKIAVKKVLKKKVAKKKVVKKKAAKK